MKIGVQVGLGPGHIVLDGDPAPLPKGAQPPQFSACIHCGQMYQMQNNDTVSLPV